MISLGSSCGAQGTTVPHELSPFESWQPPLEGASEQPDSWPPACLCYSPHPTPTLPHTMFLLPFSLSTWPALRKTSQRFCDWSKDSQALTASRGSHSYVPYPCTVLRLDPAASTADKDKATKDQSQCPDPGSVGVHLVAQSGAYEGQPPLYIVLFGVTGRA